ncbi:MAG: hypothetical protein JWO92_1562 [Chitinophagaceae bacterium]|nr:hypothetical protein [Chitinophagaceae bacterium]MDB5223642.1 hypothetical protein [Chitinophagaceae bacterium]
MQFIFLHCLKIVEKRSNVAQRGKENLSADSKVTTLLLGFLREMKRLNKGMLLK